MRSLWWGPAVHRGGSHLRGHLGLESSFPGLLSQLLNDLSSSLHQPTHRLPDCLQNMAVGLTQSICPERVSKPGHTHEEATLSYKLILEVAYRHFCHGLWVTSWHSVERDDTKCKNQEAGILGGSVGGCQPHVATLKHTKTWTVSPTWMSVAVINQPQYIIPWHVLWLFKKK